MAQTADATAPTPPFSLDDYPMQLVSGTSGSVWAQRLLGGTGWKFDPRSGGVFNAADQSVASVQEAPNLQTVMVEGASQEVSSISFVCVGGPGASTVDVAIYPASIVGGAKYEGWNGSSFEPGPAIGVGGYYWYRLAVEWQQPFSDPSAVFYAKTYRAQGTAQPFTLWAFRAPPDPIHAPGQGNLACLYECAALGPFLRARLTSEAGRGALRVTYNWLYSALNCDPNDASEFLWDFVKLPGGKLALSPSAHSSSMTLYASVRDDNNDLLQVQAPGSADWITRVGRDEELFAESSGILEASFRGFNTDYVAVNQSADSHGGHIGYRVRASMLQRTDDCTFAISNATVLQPQLDFLAGYQVTAADLRAAADAYAVVLTDAEIQQLLARAQPITPALLAQAHQRYVLAGNLDARAAWTFAGAVVFGLIGAVVGGIMTGFNPAGVGAGAALGAAWGAYIGSQLEPSDPHNDPTNTIDARNPSIARTFVRILPAGGPYENRHLWEDLGRLTKFPQIGDPALPDAGCIYPPGTGNAVQIWFPTRTAVGSFVHNKEKYGELPAPDGTVLGMALFIVVQVSDGTFQMRCHPDQPLLHGPERPNHSQLTQDSRIRALMGGAAMHVYAAGEMFVTTTGQLRGITSKTGHYFNYTSNFDRDVTTTTLSVLRALGYSTDRVLIGDAFWNWMTGRNVRNGQLAVASSRRTS